MKCCSCGADLGFDDDPYADPDCMECLKRSIQAEIEEEERTPLSFAEYLSSVDSIDWYDE